MGLIKDKKICVIMGGTSSEREISIESGSNISKALRNKGYKVVDMILDTTDAKEIISFLKSHEIDLVFIALHGEFGEDGKIQAIFERVNIPFTGSGSFASKCSLDKILSHQLLTNYSIVVPEFWLYPEVGLDTIREFLPVMVKPSTGGSSIGISFVDTFDSLEKAVSLAKKYSSKVLIERYIKGREFTVSVLGENPLVPIEIIPKKLFFDYNCKYEDNMTDFVVPAKINSSLEGRLKDISLNTHRVLGCQDFSRTDLLVDPQGEVYVLELNSIPGFTSHSLLPRAALYQGIEFDDLCEKIVLMAAKRFSVIDKL